ncbi:MAG: type II toxin-antitoxin system VapC family toxin [Chloroflexi bacterium]|nr:type II toxin-antitoxin system VapC family toxin [Chloroflexota bacterium]
MDDFTGRAIYLDTMMPYMLLRAVDEDIKRFFLRIEQGDFLAYTSILTFDELAYRLLLAFIKDRYGGSPLDRLRRDENGMMAEFSGMVADLLHRLRDVPHLIVLDVLSSDLETLNEAMVRYRLRPRDALHLAAMERIGCFDLASTDAHFDVVPHIRRFTL